MSDKIFFDESYIILKLVPIWLTVPAEDLCSSDCERHADVFQYRSAHQCVEKVFGVRNHKNKDLQAVQNFHA